MSRFRRFIAMLLVIAMVLPMIPASALAAAEDSFAYTVLEDGTLSIDGFAPADEDAQNLDVQIPSEIDAAVVAHLSEEAFAYNEQLRSVVIPASVAGIGNSAFYHCANLKAIAFLGDAPQLGVTVAEGSHALEKLFVLSTCSIEGFCTLLLNDLGEEKARQVEVLEFDDVAGLMEAYEAYIQELDAQVEAAPEEEAVAEQPEESVSIQVDTGFVVNPLYADVLTEEDFDLENLSANSVQTFSDTPYTSETEFIQAVREYMKNRVSSFSVAINPGSDVVITTQEELGAYMDEVLEPLFDHTGDPMEGDYLKFQYGGYKAPASYNGTTVTFNFTVPYYTTLEQEEEMDTAVAALLKELALDGQTDYAKVCGIYDYICANITYDYDNLEDDSHLLKYTAYAALVNKTAVCQGYANLFYRLALELDVDARIIAGVQTSSNVGHAWNIVGLDKLYYNLDSTWDAGMSSYNFFLRSNANFADHTRDAEYEAASFYSDYPMSTEDYTPPVALEPVSGTCGDGLTWTLDLDGLLTISGTGSTGDSNYGWSDYSDRIKTVVVESGVTYVGHYAFDSCYNLTSVQLPDSVTKIGMDLFLRDSSLTSVRLPANLTSIPEYTFSYCYALKDVNIPDTITDIGSYAFQDCEALTQIALPKDLITLGAYAFKGCLSLEEITIPGGVVDIPMYAFKGCQGLTGLTISEGVKTIGKETFRGCSALTELTIPSTVTQIGDYAFAYSDKITSITFAGSAPTIGEYAFGSITAAVKYLDDGTWTAENMLDYGGTLAWAGSGTEEVPEAGWTWSFDEESGILTISGTGDVTESLAGMPWTMAGYLEQIETVVIGEGITSIPGLAFHGHTALENVILPDSLQTIGNAAFGGCCALQVIVIPAGVTSIGDYAFDDSGLQQIYFLGSRPALGGNTFSGLTRVEAYYIYQDSTWDGINESGFGGEVDWYGMDPYSDQGIYGTFRWTMNEWGSLQLLGSGTLESQSDASGYPWYTYRDQIKYVSMGNADNVPQYAFDGYTALESIYFGKKITSIGAGAFRGCGALVDIGFSGDMPTIAADAFTGVTATAAYPGDNATYTAEARQGYGGELTWMLSCFGTYGDVTWEIYANYLHIGGGTLETLEDPSGYPWYPYMEQVDWLSLFEINVPDNLFAGNTGLKRVSFGYNMGSIGSKAFSGCTNLTEIQFDCEPMSIAQDAFEGVTARAVYTPGNNWNAEDRQNYGGNLTWAMQGYGQLVEEGTLSDGAILWNVDSAGNLCISGSSDMPDFASAEAAPWHAFGGEISRVYLAGLTGIGDHAFENLTGLEDVSIPDTVTRIGSKAFSGCPALSSIRFEGAAPTIAEDAFTGVTADATYTSTHADSWTDKANSYGGNLNWYYINVELASGTLESGVTWSLMDNGNLFFAGNGSMGNMEAGSYPWSQYADMITFISLDGLTDVGDYAFANFTKLQNVTIGENVTSIGAQAFGGCSALEYIYFDGPPPTIAEDAFAGVEAHAYIRYSYEVDWEGRQLNYGGTLNWGISYYSIASGWLDNGLLWNILEDGCLNFDGNYPIETMAEGTYPWMQYADSIFEIQMYSVTSVGDHAFQGLPNLQKVSLQNSMTDIGAKAFADCGALSEIYFYCGAPAIAEDAFAGVTANAYYHRGYSGWNDDVLQNYGGELTWNGFSGSSSSIIGQGSFGETGSWTLNSDGYLQISGSGEMGEFTAASEYPWYEYESQIRYVDIYDFTTVGAHIFEGYSALEYVEVHGAVTSVESSAFADCAIIERVWFYGDVVEFEVDSFRNTTCQIGYPSGNETWYEISGSHVGGGTISWTSFSYELSSGSYNSLHWSIQSDGMLYINGAGTVEAPGEGEAYPWASWMDQIKSIHFDSYNEGEYISVGDGAFRDYTGITSVHFGERVSAIGSNAFTGCSSLSSINFSGTAPQIAEDAFSGVTATAYYPDSDELWPESLRQNYGGELTWYGQTYTVASGNWEDLYWDLDSGGRLYISGSEGEMPSLDSAESYPWYEYRDQVVGLDIYAPTTIGDYAFQNYPNLASVYLGSQITAIGTKAFAGCAALNMFSIEADAPAIAADALEGNNLTFRYPVGYEGWDLATTLTYGANSIRWEGYTVWVAGGSFGSIDWNLQSDGTLHLGGSQSVMDNLDSASGYPWNRYADRITYVHMYGITGIGSHAFEGMTVLNELYMNHDVTSIGDYAFAGCTALTEFTVESTVTALGNNIFDGAANLSIVTFEQDPPAFSENTFAGANINAEYDSSFSGWTADVLQSYGGSVNWTDINEGYSGTSGDLSWELKGGVLTISGSGAMGEEPEWKNYSGQIRSVVIESGGTSISQAAFSGLSNMTGISIPDTVTSIGNSAFGGSGLTQITIPGSVTDLGDMILGYCENLTGATFEEGVTTVPVSAFEMCGNLTTVDLPGTLQSIGDGAFMNTALSAIDLPEGLLSIGSNAFCSCANLTEIYIPSTVVSIDQLAFQLCTGLERYEVAAGNTAYSSDSYGVLYGGQLESLLAAPAKLSGTYTMPATVEQMDGMAFDTCEELTAIYVEAGNSSFCSDSYGVLLSGDKTTLIRCPRGFAMTGGETYEIPSTVMQIDHEAFRNCTLLTELVIPANVQSITYGAFNGCTGLKSIFFRGNAPYFSDEAFTGVEAEAFYPEGLASWTSDVMQNYGGTITWTPYDYDYIVESGVGADGLAWSISSKGVLTISGNGPMTEYSYGGMPWIDHKSRITSIVVEEGVTSIGSYAFSYCSNVTSVSIPSTVTSIGDTAMAGLGALTELTLPEGIARLGTQAFAGSGLTRIHIPASVTEMDGSQFQLCSKLTELTVAEENETFCAVDHVLYSGDMKNLLFVAAGKTGILEIPAGVETALTSAFGLCDRISEIHIPASLSSLGIGTGSFIDCDALEAIVVGENNKTFKSVDGVLFTVEGEILIACPVRKGGDFTVPAGTQVIGDWAFYNSALTGITLPEGLTSIGSRAFMGCAGLKEVYIPGTVTDWGEFAFTGAGLQQLEIGYGVEELGEQAFSNNTGLTDAILPNSLTGFGYQGDAFMACDSMVIHAHADSAAYEYSQTYGFDFEELDHAYENGVCKYCAGMDPDSGSCGDDLTWRFDAETGTLTISGTGEMYDYASAAPMAMDPVTSVPRWSDNTLNILRVVIEEGVTSIGSSAFWNCYYLQDVVIPSTVTSIGDSAFTDCEALTAVTLPEGLTYLGTEAFRRTGLKKITIPARVSFGEGVFSNCYDLSEITLSEGLTDTGAYTFQDCDSITTLEFPSTLQTIGEGAFWACDGLEEVTLPENLQTIGDVAFSNCIALKQIRIPASVTTIGKEAFGWCSALTAIEVDEGNTTYCSDASGVLYDAAKTRLIQAPAGLSGAYEIPASVTAISDNAFCGCSGLTAVTFMGKAPTFEGSYVFSGVAATAYYPEADSSWTSGVMASYGGSITWESYEVIVASGDCGENAAWALTSRGVLRISGTGAMGEFGRNNMPWRAYKSDGVSLVIEEGITTVCDYAFYQYQNLRSISLPTTLTGIGSYAFNGVTNVNVDLLLPEGLTTIGDYAFASNSFTSVTMPGTLKRIGEYAFAYGDDIRYVRLNEGLESIGTYAFYECQKLAGTLTIPEGITTIEPYTFYNTAITGLNLPSTLESIRGSAFYSCGELQQLTLPEGLKSIGTDAFRWCSGITGTLVIPDSVTYLDGFYNCEGITGLKLGSGVKNIASWAFKNCTGLTGELVLPDGLTTIGDQAFNMCSGLTGMLTIPDSVTTLGYLTFGNCSGLTGLKLSEALTEIPNSAFANCSGITGELVIPDSVQTVHRGAFEGLSGLTKITLGTGLTTIGTDTTHSADEYSPFYGCSGVTEVRFHAVNAPKLYNNPFAGMSVLETVYMPAENFESYAPVRAYLSDEVTIETDWEQIPVTGLTVDRAYSKSVVLHWDDHIGHGLTGYTILRDGEVVGTVGETTFTDSGLTAETTYSYAVCPNFDDVVGVACEAVTATTILPLISKIAVKSGTDKIGNVAGYNEILAYVPDLGNLEALGEKQTSVAVYYGTGGERTLIGNAARNADLSSDKVAVYSLVWDLTQITDGSYTITAVLTDVDGTTADCVRTLTVDNTPPEQLELVAVGDLTCISLNWSFAKEADTTIYRIYRRVGDTGEFTLLKEISGRDIQTYTDKAVEKEQTYYYYVVGVDPLGREGEPSETASGSLVLDTQNPRVIDLTPESGRSLNETVSFTAVGQDNLAVTEMVLSYSADDGLTWTEMARGSGSSVTGTLDTTVLPDGKLMVRAVAYDAAGNVSDNFDNTYTVDNTGPEQVTGLSYVSTSVTLTLSWNDVADEDIGGFKVERRQEDGTYVTVSSSVTALGINIRDLAPATSYTYRVTAFDRLGNYGTPSEDFTATTVADVTAPVVVQLQPASGRYSTTIPVSATMRDDDGIASITLQYSTDGIYWTDICTEQFENPQTVQSLSSNLSLVKIPEGTLYISALATDPAGNVTTQRTYTEHRVDKTEPAAPTDVTAVGGNGYIEISWVFKDSDVGEFALYRAEAEDGEFRLLRSGIQSLNTFDRDVEDQKTYYYRVAVRDTAGNWSAQSGTVSAAGAADTEAPEILSIYPAAGTVISSKNAQVGVAASDNSALNTLLIEYSADGKTFKTLSELVKIGTHSTSATAAIPVDEFAHGDTVHIRATATDMAGFSSETASTTVVLDQQAPGVADVTAVYADEKVTLTWTGMMEADLAGYRIYRKVDDGSYTMIGQMTAGETGSYTYTDSKLGISGGSYTYQVQAVDNVHNVFTMESQTVTIPAGTTPPEAAISCETTQVVGAEYVIDASASTDDSAIVSYLFDFGDGTTSTEVAPLHVYAETGTYSITLTVTDDDGNTDTAVQTVVVESDELLGSAKIFIVDEHGTPVPDAPVYFDLGEEYQVIKLTDGNGMVTFPATVGKHTVGCVIPNNEWLPVKHDMIVTAGGTSVTTMTLVNKPLVEGSFEVERMTLEEIIAAGIDIDAAENQNYVEVHINLEYENMSISTSVPAGPGFTPLPNPIPVPKPSPDPDPDPDPNPNPGPGPDPGPDRIVVGGVLRPYKFSEEVTVILLDIPVGVSSLKEFFDVRLHIINNAGSEFYLVDNVVTLNVPDGLALMETEGTDPQTVNISQLRGQTTETLEWILRGDAVGEYYLDADFSGILAEFNELIEANFRAEEPIEVLGMSDLRLIVDVAKELDKGTLYYNVSLVNEGDLDVYRPAVGTSDVLIEMEMFNATGANEAEKYDFDAEIISKKNLSASLSELPDVLSPGERLTLHYMNVADTTYTECIMALKNAFLEYENQLGLKAELEERELSFFTENLSTNINTVEKAQNTLSKGEAKSAYDYVINNEYYVYWAMANNVAGLEIKSDSEETLFETMSLNFSDALGKDDQEQARAMVLASVDIAAEENTFAKYDNMLNWLALMREIVKGNLTGLEVTPEQAEAFGFALDEIESNRKWELYKAIHGTTYQDLDKLFVDTVCVGLGIEPSEEVKEWIHKIYASKPMGKLWKKIGVKNDFLSTFVDILNDVNSDISIYVAAHSDLETYNLYLDSLIQNMGFSKDAIFVGKAALDVKNAMNSESIMETIIVNTMQEGFWLMLEAGTDKVMKAAKKVPIVNIVVTALEIGTEAMDKLFNMNEQYDVANNIRFLNVMSNSIVKAVKAARTTFKENGDQESASNYMKLLSYLLDLRALGESQAAQYGVSFEKGILPIGSWVLFDAACDYTNAPGDVESWYEWRDFVEDKLSMYRVTLLKNPLSSAVSGNTAPTVTFNYLTGQTVEAFTSDYEYSLDGGATWTTCDGSPIGVQMEKYSIQLLVRRVNTADSQEKMTASVMINGITSLESSGIEAVITGNGYRIDGLDEERKYEVTFSETPVTYEYGDALEREIMPGESSYEYDTDQEYAHIYIRAVADADHYATHAYEVQIVTQSAPTVDIDRDEAAVNDAFVKEAIDASGGNGAVVLTVSDRTGESGEPITALTMTGGALARVYTSADEPTLTLELGSADVKLDTGALGEVLNHVNSLDEEITVTVEPIDENQLSMEQQIALNQEKVSMVISATMTCGNTTISDFGRGTVTVSIPFTVKAPATIEEHSLWYIADNGTMEELSYEYVDGRMVTVMEHFSEYVILHNCEHEWKDATCTDPKTCGKCGETEGEPLGHKWTDATCTTPKTCSVCGETEGEALGHKWNDATCTEPKTCSVCGETEGEALGHKWNDATCTEPKTCSVCGETEGEALGHKWNDATCTEPKTCSVCGETEGEALGHKWNDATCTTPKTCSVCGETEGEAMGHKWNDATCTTPKTCSVCGETEGEALGHKWNDATCTTPKTCSVCGETEGGPLGHKWTDATCTTPKTCSVCGETEGEPLGHKWTDATCTEPKTCSVCGETEGEALGHDFVDGKCSRCGEKDPDYKEPEVTGVTRIFGATRYDTAFKAADQLKANLGIEKFENIVVAYGEDFADALSGSYLANQKNAPILLVKNRNKEINLVKDYIKANLTSGGTVYLLGGVNAVPKAMESGLEGFNVKRLAGATRYETNLEILKEAGISGNDILVCTGLDFADGLSASAVNKPILLVKDSLRATQVNYLKTLGTKNFYLIGGTNAVNKRIESSLGAYGTTQRIEGATRYYTSVNIAKTFFPNAKTAVLAYAQNFPDGLSGGCLACSMNAPLILTANGKQAPAVAYAKEAGITGGAVLGGTGLIPDRVANAIFRIS